MTENRAFARWILTGVFLIPLLTGCQTLREITNLRKVDFGITGAANVRLAEIDLDDIRSYSDLRPSHLARLIDALSSNELPLSFSLELSAHNPEENAVGARLVTMDWTLFLEDRETISGTLDENILVPPGETRAFDVPIKLDLLRFFEENARDLVDLALAVTGRGGAPKTITLQATPIIQTRLGEIRYSEPITIEQETVGKANLP